ncbi:hypothetical protein [Halostreptopolyspora alba]
MGDGSLICAGTGQGLIIAFTYGAVIVGLLLTTVGVAWPCGAVAPWFSGY